MNQSQTLRKLEQLLLLNEQHFPNISQGAELEKSINGLIVFTSVNFPAATTSNLIHIDELSGYIKQADTAVKYIRAVNEIIHQRH